MPGKQKKRVLMFSLMYHPFVGGAEVAIKEITDRIDSSSVEFDMITLRVDTDLPEIEKVGNITIHRVGKAEKGLPLEKLSAFPWYLIKVGYVWWAYKKARALARGHKYDLYWSIMTNMGFPVVVLRTLAQDRTPFLLTLQDGDTEEYITKRFRIRMVGFLLKRIFKEARHVQAISNYLARFAKSMGYRGAVSVIPNGVDYAHFADPRWMQAGEKLAEKFGKKPDETYLITTSRLVAKNGIQDILKSLSFLPDKVKLLVLGEGPLGEELWNKAKEFSVAKRVRFLGYVSHKDLPPYLYVSDVFVRPSLSEGMGNSFIEAMAAGVPVIGTPVGGIPDFLIDPSTTLGKVTPTGLMCKPSDPKSIAENVDRYIHDNTLRLRIVANARAMVKEKYDWSMVANDMKKLFERL